MNLPTDVASTSDDQLDAILVIQTAVARLGEKPLRSWWNSDIADADGGADLLDRLISREMVPLAILEGLLLSAARTEQHLLAPIPAPEAYSLFCPAPELRVALRRRLRHFKAYSEDVPATIKSLVVDPANVDQLTALLDSAAAAASVAGTGTTIAHDRTRFGIELKIGTSAAARAGAPGATAAATAGAGAPAATATTAASGDRAVAIALALARVAFDSARGQYTLPYYRETPRG